MLIRSQLINRLMVVGWLFCAGQLLAAERPEQLDYFETHIRPVLVQHCYACHSAEHSKSEGGLLLDSGPALLHGGDSGPALEPGQPEASLLLSALRYQSLEMPPAGRLDEETIRHFEHWIAQGAIDPRQDETGLADSQSEIDWQQARQHWAFQPLADVAPPTGDCAWSRNAIDRFIAQGHQLIGLAPAAEADRVTWLRRVTFDLVGLPPTVDQLQQFLEDDQPDAFERVVERLLASPQYGERWGRFWLDLARYADSNGADENHAYPVAWRYRDYVIEAYNADRPYDQFIREQLAGDLLPTEQDPLRRQRLTATGFLVLGPKMLAEQDKPKLVTDIVDEQIDTVGKVFLGLTLGCARCHDHKFDPIPTQDYYALAGIFHSTKTMEHLNHVSQWNERELPDAERAGQIAEHQVNIDAARQRLEQLQAELGDPAQLDEAQQAQLTAAKEELESLEKELPALDKVMAVADDAVKLVAVHVRGSHLTMSGQPLPRRLPQALQFDRRSQPEFPEDESGRLELAQWLTEQAAPLTARVIVNRIWQGHFGEGLVRTPSNFGLLGQPPTHPQLLDWLARQLIDADWSIKFLHRLIVLSSTYRLSSQAALEIVEQDPDNRWWLRFPRRRLEIEPLRDALLVASGELDAVVGGQAQSIYGDKFSSMDRPRGPFDAPRRTLYLSINRAALEDVFATFDYVDPAVSLEKRPTTTVPHQVLFLQNHPLPMHSAWLLAERLQRACQSPEDKIDLAYRILFSRQPTATELAVGLEFIKGGSDSGRGRRNSDSLEPWASYCRGLILTNEFLYVD